MTVSTAQIVNDIIKDTIKQKVIQQKKMNFEFMYLFTDFLINTDNQFLLDDIKYDNKFEKIFYIVSYFTNNLIIFRGSDPEVIWKIRKYGKVYPSFKKFSEQFKGKKGIERNINPSTCILECSVTMISKFLQIPNIMSQSFYRDYSDKELHFRKIENHRQNVLINLPKIFDIYTKKIQDEYKLHSSIFMLGEIKLYTDPDTVIDLKYEYSKDIKKKFEKYNKCCIIQLIVIKVRDSDTALHQNFLVFRKGDGETIEVDRYEPHGVGTMTEDSDKHLSKYLSMIGSTSESKLSFIGDRSISIQRIMDDKVGFCSTISLYMMLVFATAYILYDNSFPIYRWITSIDLFIHNVIESKSKIAFGSYYKNKITRIYYYLFSSIIESLAHVLSKK